MRPMQAVLAPGTHSVRTGRPVDVAPEWHEPGSRFREMLSARGHTVVGAREEREWTWDTNLGGVGFGDNDLLGWMTHGIGLYNFCVPVLCPDCRIPASELLLITHSHGMQPALFACAKGLKVDTLVTVAGPVRKDMYETAKLARPNIRRWVHLHGGRRDRWQWFGTLFDGHLGIVRKHPLADENIGYEDVDHGELLRDHRYISRVLDAIAPAAVAAGV